MGCLGKRSLMRRTPRYPMDHAVERSASHLQALSEIGRRPKAGAAIMPNGILRLDRGEFKSLTQRQKAELLGISQQYLCDLQSGRRRLSAAVAVKLERFGIQGCKLYMAQASEDLICARAVLEQQS